MTYVVYSHTPTLMYVFMNESQVHDKMRLMMILLRKGWKNIMSKMNAARNMQHVKWKHSFGPHNSKPSTKEFPIHRDKKRMVSFVGILVVSRSGVECITEKFINTLCWNE